MPGRVNDDALLDTENQDAMVAGVREAWADIRLGKSLRDLPNFMAAMWTTERFLAKQLLDELRRLQILSADAHEAALKVLDQLTPDPDRWVTFPVDLAADRHKVERGISLWLRNLPKPASENRGGRPRDIPPSLEPHYRTWLMGILEKVRARWPRVMALRDLEARAEILTIPDIPNKAIRQTFQKPTPRTPETFTCKLAANVSNPRIGAETLRSLLTSRPAQT